MTDNKNKQYSPLVLVADDEVHTTLMLERIFEREGYRVVCANDGDEALELAKQTTPDLILLDIQMPKMSGFTVLENLRKHDTTANIPTILITAKAREPADVEFGLNLGADDYLYKPFDPRELLARAVSKMKARQLEDSLHRRTHQLQSLVRVGEALNQSLAVQDLLSLVLRLSLDLLPADVAMIYQFNEVQDIIAHRIIKDPDIYIDDESYDTDIIRVELLRMLQTDDCFIWENTCVGLNEQLTSGMAIPLGHGSGLLGMLTVVTQADPFDEEHIYLFKGIGRQAALALHNATLYEIQADYATHLEKTVEARTTELKSAQQMLLRSEKLASVGHLAASIAHEINNPLQPIRIHLEHMSEDLQHGEPIDAFAIESIQESIERITRIVSQLLEFAGKRSSSSDVQFIDISRTLKGVVSLNEKLFEQAGLKLELDLPELPSIYGSKDQLEQVFMNLALNAQFAMQPGGKLHISAEKHDDHILIVFADTGEGISPSELNKIFDPFYSTKPNGTGLGLFVSYGIIQNHHGQIEVDSKVGEGTTFTIHLPIDAQPL